MVLQVAGSVLECAREVYQRQPSAQTLVHAYTWYAAAAVLLVRRQGRFLCCVQAENIHNIFIWLGSDGEQGLS